jgi:hypothetical protein
VVCRVFQYELDNFGVFDHWRSILRHLNCLVFSIMSLLCSFFINILSFLIILVGLVIEGGLGIWFDVGDMYMWDWDDIGFGIALTG